MGQTEAPPGNYKAISAGLTGTCALTEAGEMTCWGWDTYVHEFEPGPYRAVTMPGAWGYPVTCAITKAGVAVCKGPGNFVEPVEFSEGAYRSIHVRPSGVFCALAESGEMHCRINNQDAPLPWTEHAVVASDGPGPVCFFTDEREVVCRDDTGAWSPDLPAGDYVAISVGPNHGCSLTEAGEVRCWGTFEDQEPVQPPPGRYIAISSSENRVCAVTEGGDVVCLGETDYLEPPASDPYW